MTLTSQVIISGQIKKTLGALEVLRTDESFVEFISPSVKKELDGELEEERPSPPFVQRIVGDTENFRVEDAKKVLEKAYLASEEKHIIILAADAFTTVIQNRLLKVLEEPPENKIFILLTHSKASILPTIKSRLPVTVLSETKREELLGLNMTQLNLASAYEFVKKYQRTNDKKVMKRVVEDLLKEAIDSQSYDFDEKSLQLFSDAYRALDVGSNPQFILNTLLLKLLARKKR